VADDADHELAIARLNRAETDLDWELAAIFAPPKELQANAHRPCVRVCAIPGSVAGMASAESLRHEALDRAAQQILARVAEGQLGLAVHTAHNTSGVDDYHTIGRGT